MLGKISAATALVGMLFAQPSYAIDKPKLTEIVCSTEKDDTKRPKYHIEGGLNSIDFVPGYTNFTVQTVPYNGGIIVVYHLMDITSQRNPKNQPGKLVVGSSANPSSGDLSLYPIKTEDHPKIKELFNDGEPVKVIFFECK